MVEFYFCSIFRKHFYQLEKYKKVKAHVHSYHTTFLAKQTVVQVSKFCSYTTHFFKESDALLLKNRRKCMIFNSLTSISVHESWFKLTLSSDVSSEVMHHIPVSIMYIILIPILAKLGALYLNINV